MATIRPFRAIRPTDERFFPHEYLGKEPFSGLELDYLQYRLEPATGGISPAMDDCRAFFDRLLETGSYRPEDAPALYVYQVEREGRRWSGVWALTGVEDALKGKIIAHEQVLSAPLEQQQRYRRQMGLEGSPIVLAYQGQPGIRALIERARARECDFGYSYQQVQHRFWRVRSASEISALQAAFGQLDRVWLADGHHRLAAARAMHGEVPQWISSLYVERGELRIDAFHRVVACEDRSRISALFGALAQHCRVNVSPDNRPVRPKERGEMGMCLDRKWFQLYRLDGSCPLPDCDFLQQRILSPALGIADPAHDGRLQSMADPQWRRLLLELHRDPSKLAFTLFPVGVGEFLELAESGRRLPPKSTYIWPRGPFGLLMHAHGDWIGEGRGG